MGGATILLDGRFGDGRPALMRRFCVLMVLAAFVILPAGTAWAAELPPFEMETIRQPKLEVGESIHVYLSFPSSVEPEELVGLIEARKVGGGADPIRPEEIVSGFDEGEFTIRIRFPTSGTWEVVVFPEVADRAGLLDAGYPDRFIVEVRQPAPGWVVPIAVAGAAVLVIALALAGGARGSRPVVAPWDRTGKAGNRFSREPR